MAYKDILIHCDDSPAGSAALAAGLALARTHQAHVTILTMAYEPGLPVLLAAPYGIDASTTVAPLVEQSHAEAQTRADATAKKAAEAASMAGVPFLMETNVAVPESARAKLIYHARRADLTVIGHTVDESAVNGGLIEAALFESGRPVLLAPERLDGNAVGVRVVIAWDGGREAARTVNDALPILEKAEVITVLTVGDKSRRAVADDLAMHLARHSVTVDVAALPDTPGGTGETIRKFAYDREADLLVMGGYGHRRLHEMIFGGVTRNLLRSASLPVFMAH